jgi:hypothetical protein
VSEKKQNRILTFLETDPMKLGGKKENPHCVVNINNDNNSYYSLSNYSVSTLW